MSLLVAIWITRVFVFNLIVFRNHRNDSDRGLQYIYVIRRLSITRSRMQCSDLIHKSVDNHLMPDMRYETDISYLLGFLFIIRNEWHWLETDIIDTT